MAERKKSDSKSSGKAREASGKKKRTSLYQSEVRMPPHNTDAEISTLGSLMIDKNAITKVADILQPEDFYKEKHEKIFQAVQELYHDQESLDILSVSSRLKEKKQLKEVGGRSYLTEIINAVPSASNVASYANLVRKKSILRRLITAASDIVEMGYEEEKPIDEVLDKAESSLFSVGQRSIKQDFSSINNLLESAFDRIDEMHKDSGKFRGVPTGFYDLDGVLSGLQKSDLIILAARPSLGKTSFALNLAANAAIQSNIPVGVFSLEMSSDQLVDRMLAAQSGVNLWNLRTGNLDSDSEDDDFQKIGDAMGVLSEAPIYIDDSATANIMEMRTMARRLQAEKGLGLLIIDYLQLMEGRGGKSSDNRVQEISEISRGLKNLAKELNVPIIALSQLSRAVENRSPQIPRLSDLRESGSIEQDADVAMFLYREDREKPETENQNLVEVIIAKHRNGPVGKVSMFFDDATTSFKSLENKRE
ncbi:MAG: replicative DNA helicase [Candidatus Moranbacteria bacterium]|nr:replicative DNA helicase [Candidatus Moranbacteria bacterium]